MADEGNRDTQIRNLMDLNLYLGRPRRFPSHDLGSDLALGSIPIPDSNSAEMGISSNRSQPIVSQSSSPPSPPRPPLSPRRLAYNLEFDDPTYFYLSPALEEEVAASFEEDNTFPVSYGRSNETRGGGRNVPPSFSYLPVTEPILTNAQLGEDSSQRPAMSVSAFLEQEQEEERELLERGRERAFVEHVQEEERELLEQGRERTLLRTHNIPRLIEFSRGLRGSRFRRINSDSSAFSSYTARGFIEHETSSGTQKSLEQEVVRVEKEEEEDRSNITANFDCNVCLDVAKEPVVTSCGHLFCWPCLYQWLHLHSDHRECPVCKGEVTDLNITPIYGRGSSETEDVEKKKSGEEGVFVSSSSLKIPPRPKGRRSDSLRQRIQRPFLRRSLHEAGGWSSVVDEDDGVMEDDSGMREILEGTNRTVLARLMATQRLLGERNNTTENGVNLNESGSSSSATEMGNTNSQSTPPAITHHANDFWRRYSIYSPSISDRLASLAADLRMSGRVGNSGRVGHSGSHNSGSSVSVSVNPQGNSESIVNADQASASSTIAVIQGETRLSTDASVVEPSSVVSSSQTFRRRRSSVSSSVDVDGGSQRAIKRRRLN